MADFDVMATAHDHQGSSDPHDGPGTPLPEPAPADGRATPYRPNEPSGYATDRSGPLAPPGRDEATGELVLVLTSQSGTEFRVTVVPLATVNGWPVPVHWGTNVLTAPAGRHRIQVRMRYLWTSAPVEFDADVLAGRRTVVHYTAPWSLLAKGTLAYTPQPPRVGWVVAVPLAVALGIPLLAVLVLLVIGAIAG